MTKAEMAMWRLLRMDFPHHHFRKQVPIGRLTADFASHGAKLIIEVDGGTTTRETQRALERSKPPVTA